MATFAAGLKAHLEKKKKPRLLERRLLKIVNARPSKRRTAILKLLEERARDKLGMSATAAIDWGAIDWKAILDFLLKLLAIILPLLV